MDGYIFSTPSSNLPADATTIIRFMNSADDGFSLVTDNSDNLNATIGDNNASSLSSHDECSPLEMSLINLLRFSLSGVFLTIVCFLGALSNLAAFGVLFSSKKFNQSVYIYMKCLAFNDFLKLATFLVFSLYALTFLPSTPPELFLTATNTLVSIYRFWYSLSVMCQGQSIWFMSLITLDRCFALSSNFRIRDAVCRKCVAYVLSAISFSVWFGFFIINTFRFDYTVVPFCYGETGELLNLYRLSETEFAVQSWFFRISFTIVMKFILPVLLTVCCISYSTAILIHTISSTASRKKFKKESDPSGSQPDSQLSLTHQLQRAKQRARKRSLVDTDLQQEKLKMAEKGSPAPFLSRQATLQAAASSVHGRNLHARIQTAHALSWAIAASMIFCHLPASTLMLVDELTNNRMKQAAWFSISNEIANTFLISSSAINFLLFFLSGGKYRAEMNKLLERLKLRLCRKTGPPARYRCYNIDPQPVPPTPNNNIRQPNGRHNSESDKCNNNRCGEEQRREEGQKVQLELRLKTNDDYFTKPGTTSPFLLSPDAVMAPPPGEK